MSNIATTCHPLNGSLRIINEKKYKGILLDNTCSGMTLEYLDAFIALTERQVADTPESLGVKVNLYYPKGWSTTTRLEKDAYHYFMHLLNSKIRSIANKRGIAYKRVRFCRVIEDSTGHGIHIQAVLYFNRNVVGDLGRDMSYTGLYQCISTTWLKALSTPNEIVTDTKLVSFHSTGGIPFSRTIKSVKEVLNQYHSICKVDDKRYDIPVKTFSRSIN